MLVNMPSRLLLVRYRLERQDRAGMESRGHRECGRKIVDQAVQGRGGERVRSVIPERGAHPSVHKSARTRRSSDAYTNSH